MTNKPFIHAAGARSLVALASVGWMALGACSRVGLDDGEEFGTGVESETLATETETTATATETTATETETTATETTATETTATETTATETMASDSGGPECDGPEDCPLGTLCNAGMCEPNSDECVEHADCGPFELCESSSCMPITQLPDCGLALPEPLAFDILASGWFAPTFADLDDDGAHELVVAVSTQPGIHVFASGSPTPTTYPLDALDELQLFAGRFDLVAGDDIMLHVPGEQLWLIASDGMGSLGEPTPVAPPINDIWRFTAGELDGQAIDEILFLSDLGAGVLQGDGGFTGLVGGDSRWGSIRELGTPAPGISLLNGVWLRLYDVDYSEQFETKVQGQEPLRHAGLRTPDSALAVTSSRIAESWTLIEAWDVITPDIRTTLGVSAYVSLLGAADLDGDGHESLIMLAYGSLIILQELDSCQQTLSLMRGVSSFVNGDHDGDGDDELTVFTETNLYLLDFE